MNKRIFSIIMAAVMICSVICVATPEKASAASKKPYMATNGWYDGNGSDPWEKVGGHYVWVTHKEKNGTYSTCLKCAKSLKKGKAKTLRKMTSKTKELRSEVVTDGKTIYYSVWDRKTEKDTIYRTTVKGSKHKKVMTTFKGSYEKRFDKLVAFYGGKIYYTVAVGDFGADLYSYDIAKKKTRMEKENLAVCSSYGRYMIGAASTPEELVNNTLKLYDAKTGKSRSVTKGYVAAISGKTIYYATVNLNKKNGMLWAYTVKKCDLSGKNKKTIKKTPKNMKDMRLSYIGRKAAYFTNYDMDKIKKLTYSTKKLTTVK